ncbi:MAG: hypothetical protein ACE5IP_11935 [Terriglobia bacterium]
MAVQVRTIDINNSPQRRRVITDVRTTPPRGDAGKDSFFFTIFGSPELENIPFGGGVFVTGPSQRIQARDRTFSDRLLATLQRNMPAREKAAQILRETAPEDLPNDRQMREQKRAIIQAAAPLALEEKILDLDKEQQEITAARELAPIIIQFKSAQTERTRAEAAKRAAETASIIDLAGVAAEREAAQAELLRAKAAAQALQPEIFNLATGGLGGFGKMLFARELVRAAAGVPQFFGPTVRRRRTITSF